MHSSVTGFMSVELMYSKSQSCRWSESWAMIDWRDEMSREELLAARIRQLKQRLKDVERTMEKLRAARERNKGRFDQTHRLWAKKIEEGD